MNNLYTPLGFARRVHHSKHSLLGLDAVRGGINDEKVEVLLERNAFSTRFSVETNDDDDADECVCMFALQHRGALQSGKVWNSVHSDTDLKASMEEENTNGSSFI